MPREIKFRVWHKYSEEFIETESLYINYKGEVWQFITREYMKTKTKELTKSVEVELWTGHKDRNGVEIYCGDIIQYDNEKYEVYWSEDWAMFTVKGPQVQAVMRYSSDSEVIGNVHLLPKEEEPT